MNTKEIIDGLEEINYSLPHSLIPDAAIELIESLQAQLKLEHGGALAAAENCVRLQGEVNDLQAQLAKEKRRAEKAVEELKLDSRCTLCKHHLSEGGDCYGVSKCAVKGIRVGWEWRGDAEEGDAK